MNITPRNRTIDNSARRNCLPVLEVAITQRRADLGQLINTAGLFFITALPNISPRRSDDEAQPGQKTKE